MNFPYHFPRTRVKICGFTRNQDAIAAAQLGVDAIGLVFYPHSPRAVDITEAREIVDALPPFVSVVALFVDESEQRINRVLEQVKIDLLQFHGTEPRWFCEKFQMPYIKAIAMRRNSDLVEAEKKYESASALLLDGWHPILKGGTGTPFDWSQISYRAKLPIIVAGGLTVDNAVRAIETIRPYALDVSSGVESAKGIKDLKLMADFLQAVYEYERPLYEKR